MKTKIELLGATLYAFGITPWVWIVSALFGIWWAIVLVAVTLFAYYQLMKGLYEN